MARRHGRPGDWLATDDLTGRTVYGSQLKKGYYGEMAVRPFKRNLQEIAIGLDDPQPVPFYSGPQYEATEVCIADTAPLYVGTTTIRTNPNNAAFQALQLDPGIGSASIGCTFEVH